MTEEKFYPHLHTIEESNENRVLHVNAREYGERIHYYESFNGIFALMCPECFSLRYFRVNSNLKIDQHEDDSIFTISDFLVSLNISYVCKCRCSVESNGEFMDPNIAPIISLLNKKGYHTKHCCEGHPDLLGEYRYSCAYVEFVDQNQMTSIIKSNPLPTGWKVSNEDSYDQLSFVIRYIGGVNDPPEVKLEPLRQWVDNLFTWPGDKFRVVNNDENFDPSTAWVGTTDTISIRFKASDLTEAIKIFDYFIANSGNPNPITKNLRRITKEEYEEMSASEKLQ